MISYYYILSDMAAGAYNLPKFIHNTGPHIPSTLAAISDHILQYDSDTNSAIYVKDRNGARPNRSAVARDYLIHVRLAANECGLDYD